MGNIFAVLGKLTRASSSRDFVSQLDSADTVGSLSGGTTQLAYSCISNFCELIRGA
jgi:hypothetical protein